MAGRQAEKLLKEYRAKRDFSRTREPDHRPVFRSGAKGGKDALSFVVQKHDATRLHYDFRLEWDGVLKSWAVTKGPSLDPSEKRLAVRTEDHPLSYGSFEGTIPKGQYGGGTVMLWDEGTWEPETAPDEGFREGKLTFTLFGKRLKGKWSLVRMSRRPGEKRENWLLVKNEDDAAARRGNVLKTHTKSVATDRTMRAIASSGQEPPEWREPQLATLADDAPEGDGWLTEMKYDGYRALIAIGSGVARIYTRGGQDWTDKFRAIAEAAASLPTSGTLMDGEIVSFDAKGRTDFSALQKALKFGGAMTCFVFDLLVQDGEDITALPLVERKRRLEKLLSGVNEPLAFSSHVAGEAKEVHQRLCRAGYEGIIAKRTDDRYRSGRGKSWLKVKCSKRQELVIGGYSSSSKPDRPFASILLGAYENGNLVYRGRVGAGFDMRGMQDLAALLHKRARKTSPFDQVPRDIARNAHYVTPDLVAEIEFTEFTADGMVRHGVFKGLRDDKKARNVTLETPRKE